MPDRSGHQFGNYRLIHLLGRGNWASVYLGEHIHLNTHAAIKILHEPLSSQDVNNFLTEARTVVRLRHPHIIQVLDYGVEGTLPFLVMEYAPSGNLRQRHPQGTRPPFANVLSYVKQAAEALQYAHDERVIHRDIKPENMLIGQGDTLLLGDFGIAVIDHTARSLQSQHIRDAVGTIAYMALEQIQGHPTFASDQYALAVVVYEWLCGERPFHGTLPEIAVKHALVPPPPLSEKLPSIPSAVEQVVLKALAKEPQQRFESVQAFARAFEEACKTASYAQILLADARVPVAATSANDLSAATVALPAPDEPPRTSHESHQHNLPLQLTPLIGREQDVAAVCALLQRDDVRLLTLTGTGGIGKTRLSVQVASELVTTFSDGVCFVQLASISNPTQVIPTIAHNLSQQYGYNGQRTTMTHIEFIRTLVQEKQLLLVLDNFEQIVTAAPELLELLRASPHLKILVSSRAVLHVQGEHEFAVPPLALPTLERVPLLESEALSHYPAVALFLQRVLAIKPDFAITRANLQAIVDICRHLDGLPLAIELAAARIKLLPPEALLQRLKHRLLILTGGAQNAPVRQQTLRDTIAWSYNLLEVPEQQLFRRLAVFSRGCTLEALEPMRYAFPGQTGEMLDLVASLIDKSLLQQTEQEGNEPRIVMLETIREYALECLVASGEEEIARQSHATYYLELAEASELELGGPHQTMWLKRLEREYDNLRAALDWSLQPGEDEHETERHIELALRLVGSLRRFWQMHGYLQEGQAFLERALAASEGVVVSVRARAKALIAAGTLASINLEFDRVESYCRQSLDLFRELGDQPGIALSLYLLSVVPWMKGEKVTGRAQIEEALSTFRKMGDQERIAWSLSTLGLVDMQEGKYASARVLYEESLAVHRTLGDKRGIATTLLRLAQLLFASQGDQVTMSAQLNECLALYKELGDKEGIANVSVLFGQLAFSRGELEHAQRHLEESVQMYRKIGHRRSLAETLVFLARVLLAQGEREAARSAYEKSLAIALELKYTMLIVSGLEGWASIMLEEEQYTWAVHLWGAAETLRETVSALMPPVERAAYDEAVSHARTRLGEASFAAAWARGRSMTPAQALATEGHSGSEASSEEVVVRQAYPAGLTTREVEVLRLVAQGQTNVQIAQKLVLSEKTVATHLTHIFNKTNSENRAAAAAFAIRHGLVVDRSHPF